MIHCFLWMYQICSLMCRFPLKGILNKVMQYFSTENMTSLSSLALERRSNVWGYSLIVFYQVLGSENIFIELYNRFRQIIESPGRVQVLNREHRIGHFWQRCLPLHMAGQVLLGDLLAGPIYKMLAPQRGALFYYFSLSHITTGVLYYDNLFFFVFFIYN